MQDDDVLGKAYDARLMRRLLVYLRPYWTQVALAFAAITIGAGMSLAQPYLVKVAIDRYIGNRQVEGPPPFEKRTSISFMPAFKSAVPAATVAPFA